MSKQVKFDLDARKLINNGVNILCDSVKKTIGPKGKNVIIERDVKAPLITNDGVTIAKEIELTDKFENLGAQIVKEAAIKTNELAGDGTTTATVLAQAIINRGFETIENGANAVLVREGINYAVEQCLEILNSNSVELKTIEEIKNVATISSASEEIGDLIANAVETIGRDGIITVEESSNFKTTLTVSNGFEIERGYLSPHLVTNEEKMVSELNNVFVCVTDMAITHIGQILKILESAKQNGGTVLLIAPDFADDVISLIVTNHIKGALTCVPIKAPGYGEQSAELLLDIAAACDASLISKTTNNDFTLNSVGIIHKALITKDKTTLIIKEKSDSANDRITMLKNRIDIAKHDFEKEELRKRISNISAGAAVIKVGARTETEMIEKKLRVEDALNATRAAIEEGILPGGGTALLDVYKLYKYKEISSDDFGFGEECVVNSLLVPLHQICLNAGRDADAIISEIMKKQNCLNYGYNAYTDEFVDMLEDGVIDPAKVTKSALGNAASVASTLITTDVAIITLKKSPFEM